MKAGIVMLRKNPGSGVSKMAKKLKSRFHLRRGM